ncbi:hypothetical protein SLS58_007169 [Diplodia intermedia]|uniref:Suppressor of anucleate metulae protein B n=1 Tax=Diplodia intermedia TaxID=856260 RepID=A0ABR3TKX9_9PEZI
MDEDKSNRLTEFTALAHLLFLRNNGAIESTSIDECEGSSCISNDDSETSTYTAHPGILSRSRDEKIFQRLLNRLSELLAVEKGGRFVSAAVLQENEKEEHVDIWVARNGGFGRDDHVLLSGLEQAMTSIAKCAEDAENTTHNLWEMMFSYSKPRIEMYRKDVTQLFQRNQRVINNALSKQRETVSEVSDIIREILFELSARGLASSKSRDGEKLDRLVYLAFKVRKLETSREELQSLLPDAALARKIHSGLCFLGRVRAAYETYITVCLTRWKGFEVRIHPVDESKPVKLHGRRLSLAETFGLIGLPLKDSTLKKYINRGKFGQREAVKEFNKLQGQEANVHAEVQLLFHVQKQPIRDCFPYVGSSKRNCFLCAEFLSALGGFGSRGSHGRPWSRWLIPSTAQLRLDNQEMIWNSIGKVQEHIKHQLLCPLEKGKNFNPESTIGLTAPSSSSARTDRPEFLDNSTMQMFLRNRDRQSRQQQMIGLVNPAQMEEEYNQQSMESTNEIRPARTAGETDEEFECDGGCLRYTSRRCGKCGNDFFCSTSCEAKMGPHHAFRCNIGRPLTTADYLMLDISGDMIPEDPDVLADFGFTNLLPREHCNLLGLYKGLDYLGVTAEQLHEWQQSGSIVEHVKETFSDLPVSSRGGYYPWFMDNQQRIFNQGKHRSDQRTSSEEKMQRCYDQTRMYLDPQDQETPIHELQPASKRKAFVFYSLIAQRSHPRPTFYGPYIDFGFCVCTGASMEHALGALYQKLLFGDTIIAPWMPRSIAPDVAMRPPLCTFTEFWQAFDRGGLTELMDSCGLKAEREKFPHLDSVLSRRVDEPLPGVWMLQTFVNDESETVAPDCIVFSYGFIACTNPIDTAELKAFYQDVLASADPLDLEKASLERRLLDFGRRHVNVSAKVLKILEKTSILD